MVEAVVADSEYSLLGDQDIWGFEIPVDDFFGVKESEALSYLSYDEE